MEDQEVYMCEVCEDNVAVTKHEVYYGTADRQISIDNGFQVRICPLCHNAAHYRANVGFDLNKKLREKFQREFEEEHTRKEFMDLIGRNYLE